ncbi:hypothetical protein EX30DRAFT_38790 [Ascodesmis nigricans]|uniref:Uncharacterized protein n=1 Tax=Ascodesmis nigricans TaxID=341454 RepID=A0A4S2MH35_9PEZI|nr:hypothetical protein EX30DRAFT_38790 [Ascodesmis nigricans]
MALGFIAADTELRMGFDALLFINTLVSVVISIVSFFPSSHPFILLARPPSSEHPSPLILRRNRNRNSTKKRSIQRH